MPGTDCCLPFENHVAVLLLINGETTEGARLSVQRLSVTLGRPVRLRVRWGLTFGAAAFFCTVSLIPGAYTFQAASGLVSVAQLELLAGLEPMLDITATGATAGLTLLAMMVGLILPKVCADGLRQLRHDIATDSGAARAWRHDLTVIACGLCGVMVPGLRAAWSAWRSGQARRSGRPAWA